ncbi:anti-sigma factor family protein [Kitasatospora sp. McL0602]|uniref:anti-sigma factor family protein n=1 Tax=Kitasatospora sp. McL0602 TaxID=3439530 RepID=UPI003F88E0AE
MTSTQHPDTQHPDIEVLADLTEDLLPPDEAAAVRTHLDGCADCADTVAALVEVQELLGNAPAPPLPAEIATRIDAALAAETEARVAAPRPTPTTAPKPGPKPVPKPAIAPPGARTDSSGPGRPRRRRRALLGLGAVGLAATLGLGLFLLQQPQHPTGGTAAASAAVAKPAAGGLPSYTDAGLAGQIHQLLEGRDARTSLAPNSGQSEHSTASTPKLANGAQPDCSAEATGHSEAPLAEAPGSYAGSAVTVLVYPLAGHSDQLDVYLVTPSCPGATLVLHRAVPAP